nr:hypothetical protein [Geodermatophilus sabuli]
MIADQRDGRQDPDRLAGVLRRLNAGVPAVLPFERTAEAEVQGVLTDPAVVVDVVLDLVRDSGWRIGVGAGPVPGPLPESVRGVPGPAARSARRAVVAAGRRSTRLAVRGAVPPDAADAQAVVTALAVLVQRRSGPAWEAVELVAGGRSQAAAAAALGISRQAVGQRLAAGLWELEQELRPTAARSLARAAG